MEHAFNCDDPVAPCTCRARVFGPRYPRKITIQSYRDIWHHKEKADFLCGIVDVSVTDINGMIEEENSVEFTYRMLVSRPSLVDSGRPILTGKRAVYYAVVP